MIETRQVLERDFPAELSVTEVRPIADLVLANANQVGQAVAAHIGQEDRLGSVGEDDVRTDVFVAGLTRSSSRGKAAFVERRVPREDFMLRDERVRKAVPSKVQETQ